MEIVTWLRIFSMSLQLFYSVEMDSKTVLMVNYDTIGNLGYKNPNQEAFICANLLNKENFTKIATVGLIPNQNLFETGVEPYSNYPKQDFKLITADEFQMAYILFEKKNPTQEEQNQLNKLIDGLKQIMNFAENNQLISQKNDFKLSNGILISSQKEYKNYIDILLKNNDLSKIKPELFPKNKMIRINFNSAKGQSSRWIKNGEIIQNKCFLLYTDSVIYNIFDELNKCIENKTNRQTAYDTIQTRISTLMDSCQTNQESEKQYFKGIVNRIFFFDVNHKKLNPLEEAYKNYHPKKTPDIVTDYKPQISEKLNEIPNAEISNFQKLYNLFTEYKANAEKNKGQWRKGNMILGAPENEYIPSDDELILSETGFKLQTLVNSMPPEKLSITVKQSKITIKQLEYNHFTYTHVDVMGSGRFFYIDKNQKKIIVLK